MEPENQEGLVGFLEREKTYPTKTIWLFRAHVEKLTQENGTLRTPIASSCLDVLVDGLGFQSLHITLRSEVPQISGY